MILKKKEIIAASLVVLIGVAGYLNWSYQDTIKVRDGESYVETGKKLGEAQYVSSNEEVEEASPDGETQEGDTETTAAEDGDENNDGAPSEETPAEETASGAEAGADYFDRAKLDREESRSKSLEILNQTAQNESFDEEIRKKAGDKICRRNPKSRALRSRRVTVRSACTWTMTTRTSLCARTALTTTML